MQDEQKKVEALYFTDVPHAVIAEKLGITKARVQKNINAIVADKSYLKTTYKQERLMKATVMEQNIFDMIAKKKDVSKYIIPFVTYCA